MPMNICFIGPVGNVWRVSKTVHGLVACNYSAIEIEQRLNQKFLDRIYQVSIKAGKIIIQSKKRKERKN